MPKLVKMKIVKVPDSYRWPLFYYSCTGEFLNGRVDESGAYQIQHPGLLQWFDVPKDMVELKGQRKRKKK